MTDEPFLVRPAGREDVDRIARLFQRVYEQSSHPCSLPDNVAAALAGGERWLVCEQEENLVACAALIPHHWNATYEAGRNLTTPSAQGLGLGRIICRDLLHRALELADQDLVFGWPRSGAMCRMVCLKTAPATHLFGHDGGANLANGCREIHAIGLVRTIRPCRRAIPARGPGTGPLFRERISHLQFQEVTASPPPEAVIGPPGGEMYQFPQGARLRYLRGETVRGWSVLVTECSGEAGEVDSLLGQFLAANPIIRHLACYVPWDKAELMTRLGALGFRATAYLPGWYLCDGVRHDCVLLTWLAPGEAVADNGLSEWLRPVQAELDGLTAPSASTATV